MSEQAWQACSRELLRRSWDIDGELTRLSGENRNYLVESKDGQRWVLKIAFEHDTETLAQLEFEVMDHAVKSGFEWPLPQIISNNEGEIESSFLCPDGRPRRARLLQHLEGELLGHLPDISDQLVRELGRMMARFDLAMENLDCPLARRTHPWDMLQAGQHADKTALIEDLTQRELLDWAFAQWNRIQSKLESLPRQVIHGDVNLGNVLVKDNKISGLLDFGDVCYNPVISELGVSACYLMTQFDDPLITLKQLVEAYRETRPLSDLEVSLLPGLIVARAAVSITMATWRKLEDPDAYDGFTGQEPVWRLLEKVRFTEDFL